MFVFLVATFIVAFLLYKLFFSNPYQDYWAKHGVFEVDASKVVSNIDILLGRKGVFDADDYVYQSISSSQKYCGTIQQGKPVVIVKDVELIKKVLIKDFDHFMDRREFFNDTDGSLEKVLFNMQGEEWRDVRVSISPTFTTGKIRRMMEYFNGVGKEWASELRAAAKAKGSINIDVLSRANQYTIDVISTTVFGLNAGTVKDQNSEFLKKANILSDITNFQLAKFMLRLQFPRLGRLLGLSITDSNALEFFEKILTQGLRQRMKGEGKRNDFLQLLVELKKGELKAEGSDELSSFEKEAQISGTNSKNPHLTEEIMIAQCVAFFFAGFSTTSNFIAFAFYALALHPEIQEKLRKEVRSIVKDDGTFDYDELGRLVYLDMVVCEVNRKFPATARLERTCVREYKDPESGMFVPKDTLVVIPLNAVHNDPQYYDNPDVFDPEHFAPDKKNSRNPYAFMPFGQGPRNCIGMRFALIQGKAGIAHIINNFKIEPTKKTPIPLQGKQAGLQLIPPKGLELKLTPI